MTQPLASPGRYDFGLTPEQEATAGRIHREAIVFDLLSQHAGANIFDHYPADLRAELAATLEQAGNYYEKFLRSVIWPYEISRRGQSDLIADWYRQAGVTVISHGISVEDIPGHLYDLLVVPYQNLPWLRHVTTAKEMRQAKADGVIASYANCQPDSSIPHDLGAINLAYQRGLRSLMLTYNNMTTVGVGCTERVDAGLSNHGVDVVKRCNDIGMIVDVSHCGHETSMDACRVSSKPVTANHTCARGLYFHARGKSDDCLRAIADTGGVVGIVAVPAFLTDDPAPTIEHMLDHIDYVADLVGWQHVAIGSDWPLQAPRDVLEPIFQPANKIVGFRKEHRLDVTVNLKGFDDVRDMPNITRGLVKRGWSEQQIKGVLGENALRVFENVCDA
ncbi:dipeptidase [Peristeroidobacter soli]|jgi:membrane dipeptidase|uniref:dipeptidase n=1 Tax=Peristeroidobacter soli TaxID=2497877 RepID=UPI00101B7F70|nr:membrane dipeptidase [Peristeroidobacter soli]